MYIYRNFIETADDIKVGFALKKKNKEYKA